MIILTNLTATAQPGAMVEPRGIVAAVHDEPMPGCLRVANLGAGGLILQRGTVRLGIPLSELWRLAEIAEPGLLPPK